MLWRKKKIVAESQFTNADDLTKEVKNYINNPDNGLKGDKLTLTGHSLGGGGLSEYAGGCSLWLVARNGGFSLCRGWLYSGANDSVVYETAKEI
ncbi:hypothetical protein ACT7CZ_30110 [Bacillus cereus]